MALCRLFLVFLLICVISFSCSDARSRRIERRRNFNSLMRERMRRELQLALSSVSGNFTISLYRKLSLNDGNLVFSPLSILTAMSMTYLGANGTTANEMYDSLGFQPFRRPKKVHKAFKLLFRNVSRDVSNVTLDMGNAVYVREGIRMVNKFKRRIRRLYGAEAENFDFTNPEGPEAPINEWIEQETGGMIRDFLDQGSITRGTAMYLINVIYFKGTWDNIFEERMTNSAVFYLTNGERRYVEMMNIDRSFPYKFSDELQSTVLELPYIGGRFGFFILLPNERDGLQYLEEHLTQARLENVLNNMERPARYYVSIPKMSLRMKQNLKDTLVQLGIREVFQHGRADLSRIDGSRRLYVRKVLHEAVLEVDERGSSAAAATGIGIVLISMPPSFRADHPFMFVLRDKVAQINLFVGRFVIPEESV